MTLKRKILLMVVIISLVIFSGQSSAHIQQHGVDYNENRVSYVKNESPPSMQEIYEYMRNLSNQYKVPLPIIMAKVEIESYWRYNALGLDLHKGTTKVKSFGLGLSQITVPSNQEVDMNKFPGGSSLRDYQLAKSYMPKEFYINLASVEKGVQGDNNFIIVGFSKKIQVEELYNWKTNLEYGVQHLLYKKIESGGIKEDSSIIENWYIPLLYYNGVAISNNPNDTNIGNKIIRRRLKNAPVENSLDYSNSYYFNYPERIFNLAACRYLPKEGNNIYDPQSTRKTYFLNNCIERDIVLPGPKDVKIFGYSYVLETFSINSAGKISSGITFYSKDKYGADKYSTNDPNKKFDLGADKHLHKWQFADTKIPCKKPNPPILSRDIKVVWQDLCSKIATFTYRWTPTQNVSYYECKVNYQWIRVDGTERITRDYEINYNYDVIFIVRSVVKCEDGTILYSDETSVQKKYAIRSKANINVRESANINSRIVGKKNKGAIGYILDGPISKNGYCWWKIRWTDGTIGWSSSQPGLLELILLDA